MSLGRMRRNKGARGEREVVELLKPIFPGARRRFTSEESQGTKLGADLWGTGGYAVQVQLAKRPTVEKKFQEAVDAAEAIRAESLDYAARLKLEGSNSLATILEACPSPIPVAFTRKCSKDQSGNPWLVTLKAEDFINLLKEAGRGEK